MIIDKYKLDLTEFFYKYNQVVNQLLFSLADNNQLSQEWKNQLLIYLKEKII
ncbi:hypothetical protein [Rickettsiella massiliensis]|uniref:hypothetical protein n=1 Tax=Rickettsiella massiliensis TaxID=676517 RepID=UPI0002E5DD2B|nr:hypothetical protein [Rickettsiella massiliensis]